MVCLEIGCLVSVGLDELCSALHMMQRLQELTLKVAPSSKLLDGPSIVTALQSCASLHRLQLELENASQSRSTVIRLYAIFAFVLEAYPALDCFGVGPFLCNKSASHLQLHCHAITEAHIRRVLDAIGGSAASWTIVGVESTEDRNMSIFVRTTGLVLLQAAGMTELRIMDSANIGFVDIHSMNAAAYSTFFACCCANLICLDLPVTNITAPMIAAHCKHLQMLTATCYKNFDDGCMEGLLAGCAALNEVHLRCRGGGHNLTMRTLHAIVHSKVRKLHLQLEQGSGQGFSPGDLTQFREMVVEQQLLPVLIVTQEN